MKDENVVKSAGNGSMLLHLECMQTEENQQNPTCRHLITKGKLPRNEGTCEKKNKGQLRKQNPFLISRKYLSIFYYKYSSTYDHN